MAVLTIRYSERTWAPDVAGSLNTEDGEVLYSHVSSSREWLEADLTRNFRREAELAAKYPDGFTLQWENVDA